MKRILSFLDSFRPGFKTSVCKSCQKPSDRLNQYGFCPSCSDDVRTQIIRHAIEININAKRVYYSDDYEEIFRCLEKMLNNLGALENIRKSGVDIDWLISFDPPASSDLNDHISACEKEHKRMLKEKNELDNFLQKGITVRTKFSSLIREYTGIKKLHLRGLENYRVNNPEEYEFIAACRRKMQYFFKIENDRIAEALKLKNEGKLTEAINIIEMNVKNEFWKKKSYSLLIDLLRKEGRYREEFVIAQKALALFGDQRYKRRCQVIRRRIDKIK